MIMCGMSAAFTALFGTPMAAAVFSIEVVSVGIMHYSALVPCVISALMAKGTASYFGIEAETFLLEHLPAFFFKNAVLTALLAILGALVSILFCIVLHQTDHLYKKFFSEPVCADRDRRLYCHRTDTALWQQGLQRFRRGNH